MNDGLARGVGDSRHGEILLVALPDALRHVVDEHPDPGRKLVPAEVAHVMSAIIGLMLSQTGDQLVLANVGADQEARKLRDALAVQDGLQHQIRIIERAS